MDKKYFRPIVQYDQHKPDGAFQLAGGVLWFERIEVAHRNAANKFITASEAPDDVLENLTTGRDAICGIDMQTPSIMGILNVTQDSFSDGGDFFDVGDAVQHARDMVAHGVNIIDIGGESTRPGASYIEPEEEVSRTTPVIDALRKAGITAPISIDTRKADVARSAINAGAGLFNDVTALSFDLDSLGVAADTGVAVCIMHASGDPKSMQDNSVYDNVLLDVYDYLETRIAACEDAGIKRSKIMIDPGIGFGKTQAHNLTLLKNISLFHALGCPILLGVSRKRFIGNIGNAQDAADRAPGSIAVGLEALNQGVQMLRVHDIAQTRQALALWSALKN